MKKSLLALTLISTFLVSCGSSLYTYHENPTPLKKGVTHYYVKAPVVNLTLGHGAIVNDKTFVSQDALAEQFKNCLTESFIANKIYTANEADADAILEIQIDYTRTFNYGGKALNKPEFSYRVNVKKNEKLLASYGVNRKTTNYGGFKDVAVNLEISAFKWGVEDEPQDIALIANTIAKEVAAMGK
jgi:hypothetical protein